MDASSGQSASERLAFMRPSLQWTILLVLSLALTAIFELFALPAALLIGPMVAAIVAGVNGATIRVPRLPFIAAQSIVGCLIAPSLSPDIFPSFAANWPVFVAAVIATIAASSFLGWAISRWGILPGTTGVWGSAPGAATAMVLMAGAFGADQRLVAFMQYLRVIIVTLGAAMIARLWVVPDAPVPRTVWFPEIEWIAFGTTIAVAVAGGALARLARMPSPFFIGSFILGSLLHLGAGAEFQLPEWLLAASYLVIGWTIGLNFKRQTMVHAARALPQILLSILALMAFCGAIAWFLSHEMGIDPLTAYLATSPGGMDSVAIIAAASANVDISFIMTLQALRFLFVLLFGPSIARVVARWVKS
ncbi:AbrB family transcriptional regulator [Aquamicrobium sp. LC103]|uniref:AbrB family transcriptional regulator n=1 Tax=Aquamicrobium sp. LC103 TaxID=1120658 RepID=UPI00063EC4EF|nr:AbrB family transcriptional regulator [Aquamicrobium sp. LC103]TKT77374.1 AbrB family transcriptional regulator [Aquamicrobium sp. LC103]